MISDWNFTARAPRTDVSYYAHSTEILGVLHVHEAYIQNMSLCILITICTNAFCTT